MQGRRQPRATPMWTGKCNLSHHLDLSQELQKKSKLKIWLAYTFGDLGSNPSNNDVPCLIICVLATNTHIGPKLIIFPDLLLTLGPDSTEHLHTDLNKLI